MAQTITTITNAANLGGNATITVGSPTKTVLQAGTLYVDLSVQITVGPESMFESNLAGSVPRQVVRVWYSIIPFTLTADATLPNTLFQAADFIECKVPTKGTAVTRLTHYNTAGSTVPPGSIARCLFNNGGNLYTWFDSPPLAPLTNTPPTITITSVEF